MAIKLSDALGLAAPLATAAAALVIARWYIAPGVDLEGMARGVAGPGTWPKATLYCVAACSIIILIRNILEILASAPAVQAGESAFDDAKLLPGIALLIGYGIGISEIGIAWSTLIFVAGWLVLSGLRRPLAVVLVSVFGTAGVLYLFVKLCMMPLERGKGPFEQATIVLYRLLGIY